MLGIMPRISIQLCKDIHDLKVLFPIDLIFFLVSYLSR